MLKTLAVSLLSATLASPVLAAPASVASSPASSGKVTVQKREQPPKDGRLEKDVVPLHQALWLRLVPGKESYGGSVDIDVDVQRPKSTLWLHARKLNVTRAWVKTAGGNVEGTFAIVDDVEGLAALTLPKPLSGKVTLHLEFGAAFHDDLNSLYRVKAGDDFYAFSQFEAIAAREAFPCFDEPGFKIPFDVQVTHLATDTAISNTKVVKEETLGKDVKTTFATTKPLPTYLLAFVVGPVDVVDGPVVPPALDRKDPLPVRAITVKGKGALVAQTVKDAATVIADQEKVFGIGYPYDKLDVVAVPDFAAGAMENAGLVTFRDTYLFVDGKSPIGAQKGSMEVISHELAHQWFGDLVTMAWWDDLWLNEAFATWFAARTVQRLKPAFDGALDLRTSAAWVMGEDSLVSARQIRQPIHNRGDIDNAFDGITYSKGAAVIAMFEEHVDRSKGAGSFNKGVSAYLDSHRFGSGTTKDFLAAISAAAGFDIAPSFSTFLDQPGVPLVTASCAVVDKKPTVTASTQRFLPIGSTGDKNKTWDLPFCVSLLDKKKPPVCTMLAGGKGTVVLPGAACPKAWHPNFDGGGYYRFAVGGPELKALAAAQKTMSVGEKLSFASALSAGFSSGTADYKDVVDAAVVLKDDAEASVALTSAGFLSFAADDVLVDDKQIAKVHKKVVDLFQPGLNKLGLVDRKNDTPQIRERRQAFFGTVVDAEGAGALAVAVAAGKDVFTTGTTKKVAQDLWPVALWAAVRHGKIDAATWTSWLAEAKKTTDPRQRSWKLHALAATVDPALSPKALELVFDKELRVNEIASGLWAQAGESKTWEGAFTFVTTRYDDIAKAIPEDWRPGLASGFSGACDDEKAARVEAFFAPKIPTTPGLDRALAQSLEEIRLCAAKKKAHLASIEKMFPK